MLVKGAMNGTPGNGNAHLFIIGKPIGTNAERKRKRYSGERRFLYRYTHITAYGTYQNIITLKEPGIYTSL